MYRGSGHRLYVRAQIPSRHALRDWAAPRIRNADDFQCVGAVDQSTLALGLIAFNAINVDDLTEVENLISDGVDINAVNEFDKTPLILSFFSENIKIIKYLIENGANIEFQSHKGWTPLMFSIWFDYLGIFKLLIQKNAKLNIQT